VFTEGERSHSVALHFTAAGLRFSAGDREYTLAGSDEDGVLRVMLGDASFRIRAVRDGLDWHLFRDGIHHVLTLRSVQTSPAPDVIIGTLAAPMPGKVLQVLVQPGAAVARGAPLVILEAMKMEHTIAAPYDGRVAEIHFKAGEQVDEGAELLRLETP
jgi:3-methylcrotonyl-CoA carboxylase alpha subunit